MSKKKVYSSYMPTQMTDMPGKRHAYMLKTPHPLRDRVLIVARKYDISYNAALNILLAEALDARGILKDS